MPRVGYIQRTNGGAFAGPHPQWQQGVLGVFGFLDGLHKGSLTGADGGGAKGPAERMETGDHGDRGDHGNSGSENGEVVTRPRALLEELGVAWHQVGKEALGLLGEALAARRWHSALQAAPFWPLAPHAAPAPPQPDLAHRALKELPCVVV